MKTLLSTSLAIIAAAIASHAANTPLTVIGFNTDLVMENTPSHFAHAADGSNLFDPVHPAWFESGLGGHADGLPSSRTFTSVAGTLFQLEPYGTNGTPSNNALRLFDGATATLTLATPVQLSSLSILAFTASGTGSSTALALTISFTDSSTMLSTYSAPDWVAPGSGIDFLGRTTSGTTFAYDTGGLDFGMTETIINLTGSGTKLVQSLTFTGANDFSGFTTTSVMAVSGSVVPEPASAVLLLFGAAICLRRRSLRTHERIA